MLTNNIHSIIHIIVNTFEMNVSILYVYREFRTVHYDVE